MVPEREAGGPVAVGLVLDGGVVDAVHAGRREHAGQGALEPRRQADVAVMEQNGQEEEALPGLERPRAGAGGQDLQRAVGRGDRHVGGVKAKRGAGVEVEIDVMDQVKAPEDGDFVRQDMPEIDAVIHHQKGDRVATPGRQGQPLRQADAPTLDGAGQRRDERRLEPLHHRQRAGAEDDIADAAFGLGLRRRAKPPAPLGQHDPNRGDTHQGRREQGAELGHSS